jgi:hypothetical protein
MRPANDTQTPTVYEVVNRAVDVVDPQANRGADELMARFEDREEPIAGLQGSIEQEIAEAVGAIDPEAEDPVIQMAGAVVTYLAFRRDEVNDDRESILRLAARSEYDGSPPQNIREWLESEGVTL